jgi:hypothetical protein
MDLRIEVTRKNKNRLFDLISELLELEDEPSVLLQNASEIDRSESKKTPQKDLNLLMGDYLSPPPELPILPKYVLGNSSNPIRTKLVGSWGQFNSFYPVKAACRIVANLISVGQQETLRLDHFVRASLDDFRKRGLGRLRGFPSSSKVTAEGRYVWHFLTTGYEMGFLTLSAEPGAKDSMPESLSDWNVYSIGVSDVGLEFARMPNDILDRSAEAQILSSDESRLLLNHLKEIDVKGYREYSLLHDIFRFLREGHNGKNDLRHWFEEDTRFGEYVASWSRKLKAGSDEESSKQLANLASTYSASKIALLRELRLIDSRRNRYDVVGEII